MKYKLLIITASVLFTLIACGKKSEHKVGNPGMHTGIVLETMNSGGYSYVEIEENGEKIWAAALETNIVKGEQVSFPDAMLMENFESKTLNRKFDKIYFVNNLTKGTEPAKVPEKEISKSGNEHTVTQKAVETGSITKAPGGYTISECFAQKKTLSGKTVKVHAKIVKYSSNIMGKNWIHLQDGTGTAGENDLTIATTKTFTSGQFVLVTGKLETDKNIGAGYNFPIYMESPEIEVK